MPAKSSVARSGAGAASLTSNGSANENELPCPGLLLKSIFSPAHQLHEARRDRQPEPGTADALRVAELREGLEDRGLLRFGNARTRVGHAEMQAALVAVHRVETDAYLDLAFLRVLDRVRHQVADHLAQAQHVALDRGRHGRFDADRELELLALRAPGEQLPDLLRELADVELLADQVHLAGFDLRVVEDVVDDLHHRLGGRAHRVHVAPLPLVEVGAGEQFRHAEHAVHRRADLVAHVGEELVLGTRQCLGPAQAGLQFPRPLDDLLARRHAQRRHVALVGGQAVSERVEVVCKLIQFVPAAPGRRRRVSRREAREPAEPRGVRQLCERLDDLPLQRIGGEKRDEEAEDQHDRCLPEPVGGGVPGEPVVEQQA